MTLSDFFYIAEWWLVWFVTGIIFLPLSALIFHSFFDRGYIFAKILGLLLISYTLWLISSLKILPFGTFSIILTLGIFLAVNTYISYKHKIFSSIGSLIKFLAVEELLFTGGLIFWSFIRAHEPSIHGLEKYMDFGFINSILRADYFPPKDLWMTPLSINYYYFGHLSTAVMTKISGIDPVISYNLTLAALFGITLAASFSIGANLYHLFTTNQTASKLNTRRYTLLSGLISAFLVTLGGNLHTIYAFFQAYTPPDNPVPFWQLALNFNFSSYWYPNATRFIPFTIHEFPIYSFVVADLHGHVLNIPFVLLTITLLVKIFYQGKIILFDYLLLGLLIASSLMTNVLDGPIYLLVISVLIFILKLWQQSLSLKNIKQSLFAAIKPVAKIFLLTILFSLPFWVAFKPFASGIGVICAPQALVDMGKLGPFLFEANHCARSPLWMLLILWGFPLFILVSFLVHILHPKFNNLPSSWRIIFNKLHAIDKIVLALSLAAFILIIIPELVYVKDIYPAHYRANTVFKFGYQAFIILGLISGYMLTRIISSTKKSRLLLIVCYVLLALVAIYPNFAINSYYGDLKTYRGLNGLSYLNELYPSDYKAILWLNENIPGQPVILEGQGDSYTDFARVSSNTGLPTVIGWPVHEWLWRGSYDEAGKRSADVTSLYESTDINLVQQLLKKYGVSYVFVGALERQKYTKLNENSFYNLGKIVFQDENTKIYQLNK